MMMNQPDRFSVQLGDFDTKIDLAFSEGEGDKRRRWGCRLTPSQARALSVALRVFADKAETSQAAQAVE